MYIDQGDILRVRVEADQFCDDEPGPQKFVEGVGAEAKGRVRAPYNVVVSSFFFCLRLWGLMGDISARLRNRDWVLLLGGLGKLRMLEMRMRRERGMRWKRGRPLAGEERRGEEGRWKWVDGVLLYTLPIHTVR